MKGLDRAHLRTTPKPTCWVCLAEMGLQQAGHGNRQPPGDRLRGLMGGTAHDGSASYLPLGHRRMAVVSGGEKASVWSTMLGMNDGSGTR